MFAVGAELSDWQCGDPHIICEYIKPIQFIRDSESRPATAEATAKSTTTIAYCFAIHHYFQQTATVARFPSTSHRLSKIHVVGVKGRCALEQAMVRASRRDPGGAKAMDS